MPIFIGKFKFKGLIMTNIITVLLTGQNSQNLTPYGYTYAKEGEFWSCPALSNAADRADESGRSFEYKEHFLNANSRSQIEDTLERIYGVIPTYYSNSKS